jgi:hypothetical protein
MKPASVLAEEARREAEARVKVACSGSLECNCRGHSAECVDWTRLTIASLDRAILAARLEQHEKGVSAMDTLPGNLGDFIQWQVEERDRLRAALEKADENSR